jgi:hypothetical protein
MRFALGLTAAAAALFICGVTIVVIGEALRLTSANDGHGIVRTGEVMAVCGLAAGIALLAILVVGLADAAERGGRALATDIDPGRPVAGDDWRNSQRAAGAPAMAQPIVVPRQEAGDDLAPAAGYTDDGWHPEPGEVWDPGPAYAWNSRASDDWNSGGQADWGHGGEADWGHGGEADWGHGGEADWGHGGEADWGHGGEADWSRGAESQSRTAGTNGRADVSAADQDVWTPARRPDRSAAGEDGGAPTAYPAGPGASYLAGPASGHVSAPACEAGPAQPDVSPAQFPEADETRDAEDTSPLPVIAAESPGAAKRTGPSHALPSDTQAKLEQIKDLYLTAEAIGEEALVKHFDQLSQRQRSLIREYFEQAGLGPSGSPTERLAATELPGGD